MAERAGGYDVLNAGGDPAEAFEQLTGRPARRYDGGHDMPSLSTVHDWLNHQQNPMTVSFRKDLKMAGTAERGIIRNHAYSVQSVDPHQGVITLVNPHGPTTPTVTLTAAELGGTEGIVLSRGHTG